MDLNQLHAFEQIVLQGSFSKAARRLNISQPTISLRIHALEQEIGGTLFRRGGNRLSLTEQGRNFLPFAQAALRAMTMGIEVTQQTGEGHRGRVNIATLPSLATGFMTATLARLHRQHPQLELTIHTGHSLQVAEMLYEHFAQIGFVTGPFFHPDMLPLLHIQEPLVVMTHPLHPLCSISQISVAELAELSDPFLCIDWSAESKLWQLQFIAQQRPLVEVPPQMAVDFLLQGQGVALLTRSLASEYLHSGRLVEIAIQGMPVLRRETVLIRLNHTDPLPRAIQDFLQIFREEAQMFLVP